MSEDEGVRISDKGQGSMRLISKQDLDRHCQYG